MKWHSGNKVARLLPIALSHAIEGRVQSLSIHTANGLGGELPRSAVGPVSREVRGSGSRPLEGDWTVAVRGAGSLFSAVSR